MNLVRRAGRGFTFTELLIAMVFLTLALLSLMYMMTFSSKSSMDAYYQLVAFSLAKEPIEVFHGFGYRWLKEYDSHPLARYPVNNSDYNQIVDAPSDPDVHPFEAGSFERKIIVQPPEQVSGVEGVRVTVLVRPIPKSRVDSMLRKDEVKIETLFIEGPR